MNEASQQRLDETKLDDFKWLSRDAQGKFSGLHAAIGYTHAISWNENLIFGC